MLKVVVINILISRWMIVLFIQKLRNRLLNGRLLFLNFVILLNFLHYFSSMCILSTILNKVFLLFSIDVFNCKSFEFVTCASLGIFWSLFLISRSWITAGEVEILRWCVLHFFWHLFWSFFFHATVWLWASQTLWLHNLSSLVNNALSNSYIIVETVVLTFKFSDAIAIRDGNFL